LSSRAAATVIISSAVYSVMVFMIRILKSVD
jgi:hypothetical protein